MDDHYDGDDGGNDGDALPVVVAWLENDAYNGIYDVNVDDGDGGKPDQHGDGGDEHDEVAGGKHVGRDREGH